MATKFADAGGLPVSVDPNVLKYGALRRVVISLSIGFGTRSAMAPIRPIGFGLASSRFKWPMKSSIMPGMTVK